MTRTLYNLVSATMREAEKAYASGNESEYVRLESVAKSTLFYALDRGQVGYADAVAIADECMLIL